MFVQLRDGYEGTRSDTQKGTQRKGPEKEIATIQSFIYVAFPTNYLRRGTLESPTSKEYPMRSARFVDVCYLSPLVDAENYTVVPRLDSSMMSIVT
jgi:hypothetical protein